MNELDEDTALAILFANTKKKSRDADLVTLAKSCKFLLAKYGSRKKVAQKIGLSTEMIRQILLPLELPEPVQDMISERRIDSIDVVKEIASLKESSKQIEAARAIGAIPSKDVRDIVRLIRDSGVGVEKAKEIIFTLKPEGLHLVMLDIDDQTYDSLKKVAKRLGFSPAILTKGILMSWLKHLNEEL